MAPEEAICAVDQQRCTLTRSEVAARLGVSVSTVRRLEWDRLHPEIDDLGVHRFDPREVEALAPALPPKPATQRPTAASTAGRTAARVFRMFERGHDIAAIVIQTNQSPSVVRQLYHEWSTSLQDGEWQRRCRSL
ncbi:MAG: hypothetical protein RL385_1338 [Pseudomonadota bacterium]|jgi:hypothetical protein